jgi:hypothetical protein
MRRTAKPGGGDGSTRGHRFVYRRADCRPSAGRVDRRYEWAPATGRGGSRAAPHGHCARDPNRRSGAAPLRTARQLSDARARKRSTLQGRPHGGPARAGRRSPRRAEPGTRREGLDRSVRCGGSCRDGHGACRRRLGGNRRRRRGRRRHRRRLTRGEEPERVDVALGVVCVTNAQMDVGAGVLGLAARPERADRRPLREDGPSGDGDRVQVQERDRVAVGCLDRHRPAVHRQDAREANDARGRGRNRTSGGPRDVHATVVAGLVLGAAVLEGPKHRPGRGPGPGVRCRSESEGRRPDESHDQLLRCQEREHGGQG